MYEGEIKQMGDKVNIRTRATITIRDYQKGGTLQIERPEAPNVVLNIDKAKYFNCICDNIDRMQSDIALLDEWSTDASEQMKITIDTDILANVYADASSQNTGLTAGRKSASYNMGVTGTPLVVTASNVLDILIDAGSVADEQNWPETGRWIVVPSWFRNLIMKSDLKNASVSGDGVSILRNGRVGQVDRWMMYVSNNYTAVTDGAYSCYNITFGHKSGLTFAAQMTEMDTLKAESTFGTLVRGLNVYGYDVTKPTSIGVAYARKG